MDPQRPRLIGIVANVAKSGAGEVLADLLEGFSKAGIPLIIDRRSAELAQSLDPSVVRLEVAEVVAEADFLVVLGGDGTILGVVGAMGDHPKPVCGINTGQLGFLTAATGEQARELVDALASGCFLVSPRTMVETTLDAPNGTRKLRRLGLNEAVVSRGSVSRIINLQTHVDGQFLNRFHADGLIVATPTGSTAYSLSAGGPLMSPDAGVFVVTPICPHALSNRSVVVPDTAEVTIRREEEAEDVILTIDGQPATPVEPGDVVRVRRAAACLPLILRQEHCLYDVLQKKLHWHGSSV